MANSDPVSAMSHGDASPKALVCTMCWQQLFSTSTFQQLCKTTYVNDGSGRGAVIECRYNSSVSKICASATKSCQWCSFLSECLELEASTKQDAIDKPIRVRLQGHTDTKLDLPRSEGILVCSCTPAGNNQFSLWLGLGYLEERRILLDLFRDGSTDPMVAVTAAESQVNLKHSSVWVEANQWLSDCSKHDCCPRPDPKPLPNRIIDVSSDPTGRTVRLVSGQNGLDLYAALSYCWGPVQPGVTNSQNFERRRMSIDTQSLSSSIQNAVWITRQLGLSYLWVDAICIIQDSLEDKVHQLETMAAVYQHSHVTIIATSSESASRGFLNDRKAPLFPKHILPFWTSDKRLTSIGCHRTEELERKPPEFEPLERRAWAFQEDLLSPRRLLFTERAMQYECRRHRVALGGSKYAVTRHKPESIFASPESIMILPIHGPARTPQISGVARTTRHQSAGRAGIVARQAWQKVIEGYTRRSLTFRDDVFSALASIAETFQPHIGQSYLAGLWAGPMLPGLLLWYACLPHPPAPLLATDGLAPSWSWASGDYVAIYSFALDDERIEWQGQLLCAHVSPRYESLPYGPVNFGYLRLKTKVRRAHYEGSSDARWWYKYSGTNKVTWYPPGTKRGERSVWSDPHMASIDPRYRADDGDVFCLALCRSVAKLTGKTQTHGLFVVKTEEYGIYRRVGVFERINPRDFDDCETLTLVLV